MGRWSHVFSHDSDFSLQSYYDRTHLLDPIGAFVLNGLSLAPAGLLHDDLTTYDIDFQHRIAFAGIHQVVWGVGYRYTHDVVENAPALGFLPTTLNQSLFSAFAQDEIVALSRLSVILGSKVEHNDYTGLEVEPNARLDFSLADSQSLWSAVSRAARTPSRVDRDLVEPAPPQFAVLKGSSAFGSEYVTAYEIGYKGLLAPAVTTSVTTFYNSYRDVRSTSFTPQTILPLFFANNLEGHTYGVEVSASSRPLDFWSVHAGYDYLRESLHVRAGQFDLNDALNETADPRHQFSLRSALDLPANLQLDATLRWTDTLSINSGPVIGEVPAYFELDSRVGWKVGRRLELSLIAQNLLHDHHAEYGFPGPTRVEIERGIYGKVEWHP